MRQIALRLYDEGIPSPLGKPMWRYTTISRLLRDRAYVGTLFYNRTETLPSSAVGRKSARSRRRSSAACTRRNTSRAAVRILTSPRNMRLMFVKVLIGRGEVSTGSDRVASSILSRLAR